MSGTCLRVTFAVLPIAIKYNLTPARDWATNLCFFPPDCVCFYLCRVDMLSCTWGEDVPTRRRLTYRGDHVEMRELGFGFSGLLFTLIGWNFRTRRVWPWSGSEAVEKIMHMGIISYAYATASECEYFFWPFMRRLHNLLGAFKILKIKPKIF